MKEMFGVPEEGKTIVYRVGGSQVYHSTLECARLRRPTKGGAKAKRPSPFDIDQAKAMGWSPCQSCAAQN